MQALTVYYSPSCAFSAGTISFLLLRGADARVVNLDEHAAERERLEQALRGRKLETPLLEAEGELHVAPPLSELKRMLERWGLAGEASPHEQLREAGGH
jgi:glutaredoxin